MEKEIEMCLKLKHKNNDITQKKYLWWPIEANGKKDEIVTNITLNDSLQEQQDLLERCEAWLHILSAQSATNQKGKVLKSFHN